MSVERPKFIRPQREIFVYGSKAEIYNMESILLPREGEAKIYDENYFPGTAIRRSSIKVESVQSQENDERAFIFTGLISLKKLADPLSAANKIKSYYRSLSNEIPDPKKISVEKTRFNNTFIINRPDRQKLVLYVLDNADEVTVGLSNQKTLHGQENKSSTIDVKAGYGLNQIMELSSFSSEFIRTMDVAAFSHVPFASGKLNMVYEIGKSVQYPIREPRRIHPKKPEKTVTQKKEIEKYVQNEQDPLISKLQVPLKYTFDDIGGMFEAKQKVREVTFLRNPEITEKWGVTPPQSILLYGEKGKTMLVHALANDLGADLYEIKTTDFTTKWVGESEKNLADMLDKFIVHKKPFLLYFHNIHTIINPANNAGAGEDIRNKVAETFRRKIPELFEKNKQAILVATVDSLDNIDESISSSTFFHKKIAVRPPDENERADILSLYITKTMNSHNNKDIAFIEGDADSLDKNYDTRLTEVYARSNFRQFGEDLNIPDLAKMCSGLNGQDLEKLIGQVLAKKAADEFTQAKIGGKVGPITQEEFAKAIKTFYHH